MMIHTQPAPAAEAKAYARIRVHSPPAIFNLWDRLPIHLQAHIHALAAEATAREVYAAVLGSQWTMHTAPAAATAG
jgi:hypothetical protein